MKHNIVIQGLDIATNKVYDFKPDYRFGTKPSYMRTPPYFTDVAAFSELDIVQNAKPEQVIWIEWPDKFSVLVEGDQCHVPSTNVWRMTKVIGQKFIAEYE